jgi:hypothetical protein
MPAISLIGKFDISDTLTRKSGLQTVDAFCGATEISRKSNSKLKGRSPVLPGPSPDLIRA